MTKLKIAAAGLLAAMTLATAGVVAVGAGRTDEPRPAMKAPGAAKETAAVAPTPPRDAKVEAPGRRPHPARGSRAGSSTSRAGPSPAPGSRSRTSGRPRVATSAGGSSRAPGRFGRWLDQARDVGRASRRASCVGGPRSDRHHRPRRPLPPGRRRSGPARRDPRLRADDRHGPALRHGPRRSPTSARRPTRCGRPSPIVFHARRFEYAAAPGKPIEGIVRDKDTGRPLAGLDPPRRGLRRTQPRSRPRASRRRPTPRAIIASPACPGRRPIASSSSRAKESLIPRPPSAPRATRRPSSR